MNVSLYEELIQGEGILVLERLETQCFRVSGVPPSWAAMLSGGGVKAGDEIDPAEIFAFLELFLRDARSVWDTETTPSLTSEAWSETLANREELAFTATARRVGGRSLLMVRGLGVDYDERCKVLRKARELALAHERLLKETSEKETLLHCLVHDIAGPMMTVANCFQLLESEGSLSESGRGLVRLGGSATHRQQSTLREMLELFAVELRALEQFSSDSASAPELLDCAHAVLKSLRHSFQVKGVTFEMLLSPPTGSQWKVVGQREKLERILYNLIDNALRQAPPATVVTLRIEDEGTSIRVSVVDQGKGVEPAMVSRLFGRFQPSTPTPGKSGLGLYFCRTMIKHWSGEIGYEPRSNSGTCFWFRLAKPIPGAGVDAEPPRGATPAPETVSGPASLPKDSR